MGNFNDINVNTDDTNIKNGKNTVLVISGKTCSAFRPRDYREKIGERFALEITGKKLVSASP